LTDFQIWCNQNIFGKCGVLGEFHEVYSNHLVLLPYLSGESLLSRRKKKAKDSDDEESDDEEEDENDENADNEESDAAIMDKKKKENTEKGNEESDDSTSKASSKTGKDFEMVENNTVDTADEEPDHPSSTP
jgi:hypothetical protein